MEVRILQRTILFYFKRGHKLGALFLIFLILGKKKFNGKLPKPIINFLSAVSFAN